MIVFIRNQRSLNFLSGDLQLSEDDAKNVLPWVISLWAKRKVVGTTKNAVRIAAAGVRRKKWKNLNGGDRLLSKSCLFLR